jgi:hypothetical protein
MDEKTVVHNVGGIDTVFHKVTNKTLHGKNVAKTPEDVLDNLTKDKE